MKNYWLDNKTQLDDAISEYLPEWNTNDRNFNLDGMEQ